MKGLRRVIVSDALIVQILSQGHKVEGGLTVTCGLPRNATLVHVERPAMEFGRAQIGATAFVFEHPSFPVHNGGDVPTFIPVITRLEASE